MEPRSELYSYQGAFVTTLGSAVIKDYGFDALSWDPDTLWLEIHDDHGVAVSHTIKNRIQAFITALTSDAPYRQWEVFEQLGHAFNLQPSDFSLVDILSPEEIAWTVAELALLGEPDEAWSSEVKGYIRHVFYDNGYYEVPDYLSFCDLNRRARSPDRFEDVTDQEIQDEQTIREYRLKAYVGLMSRRLHDQLKRFAGVTESVPTPYGVA